MGEYDMALKKMHRFDSLKKECQRWHSLLDKLEVDSNTWENYVTHSETGIVYDLRVIRNKIDLLNREMDDLEKLN